MSNSTINRPSSLYKGRGYEQDQLDEANLNQDPAAAIDGAIDPLSATLGGDPSDNDSFHKTRYNSLKSHHDKTVVELRAEVAKLTANESSLNEQLATKATNAFDIPSNMGKAEVMEWARNNPDAASIISTLSGASNDQRVERLTSQLEDIQAGMAQNTFEKAKAEIRLLVPDFDEVTDSPEFHQWAREQDSATQDSIYKNPDNARATANAIKLFKYDTGWKANALPSAQQSAFDASRAVGYTQSQGEVVGKSLRIWTASEIKKLNAQEYLTHEDAIDIAVAEGRYDPNS